MLCQMRSSETCTFCAGWTVYLIQAVAQILDGLGQVSGLSPRPCGEHGAEGGERERHGTEQRPRGTERPSTPPLHYPMHCHARLLLLQLHHSAVFHSVIPDALCVHIFVFVWSRVHTRFADLYAELLMLRTSARSLCCFPGVSSRTVTAAASAVKLREHHRLTAGDGLFFSSRNCS